MIRSSNRIVKNINHILIILIAVFSTILNQSSFADFEDEPIVNKSPLNPSNQIRPPILPTPKSTVQPPPQANTETKSEVSKGTSEVPKSSESESFESKATIVTEADLLEGSYSKGRVKLSGNVKITQSDTVLRSESAEVFAKENTSVPYRAIANGKVIITKTASKLSPAIKATAEELEYFFEQRKVILKGKPKILRGKEQIFGELVEISLDTGEVKVRGAQGILDPKSKDIGNKKGK